MEKANIPAPGAEALSIAAEAFAGSPDPQGAAKRMLETRGLLLARARALGIETGDEAAAIEAVLESEVAVPAADEAECRRFYEANPASFRSGDLVFARHILFAVTQGSPVELIRRKAEETLAQVRADPGSFESLAAERSNCPSGAQGGNLGQLSRGETVPEFERALFEGEALGVMPKLVTTRYGFHVICVDRREPGRALPFETVREAIATHLEERVQERALAQYLQVLSAGSATLVQ